MIVIQIYSWKVMHTSLSDSPLNLHWQNMCFFGWMDVPLCPCYTKVVLFETSELLIIIDNSVSLQILCGLITLYLNLTFAITFGPLQPLLSKKNWNLFVESFSVKTKCWRYFQRIWTLNQLLLRFLHFCSIVIPF